MVWLSGYRGVGMSQQWFSSELLARSTNEWTVVNIPMALSFLSWSISSSQPATLLLYLTAHPSKGRSACPSITCKRPVKPHVTCHTWRRTCCLLALAATLYFSLDHISPPPLTHVFFLVFHPVPYSLPLDHLLSWSSFLSSDPVPAVQSARCCYKSKSLV